MIWGDLDEIFVLQMFDLMKRLSEIKKLSRFFVL